MHTECWTGGRRSGKTLRAILWLLQHWDEGAVIVCPNHQRALHTIKTARDLTGMPYKALERRIIPATPEAVLKHTYSKQPFLLEDVDDIHPTDLKEIERQRKVVAYTC